MPCVLKIVIVRYYLRIAVNGIGHPWPIIIYKWFHFSYPHYSKSIAVPGGRVGPILDLLHWPMKTGCKMVRTLGSVGCAHGNLSQCQSTQQHIKRQGIGKSRMVLTPGFGGTQIQL